MTPILNIADCVIEPKHIDASRDFFDAFGKVERETTARSLVQMLQELGGWVPFTADSWAAWHKENWHEMLFVNGLDERGWIVPHPEDWKQEKPFTEVPWQTRCDFKGRWVVTHEFVCNAYRASPKKAA